MPDRPLAIITGASSGIGATFALKLAARGYDLLLIARREDRLRLLAAELAETYRVSGDFLVADLALDSGIAKVADRIRASANLGLLVNNAGFGAHGYFVESDIRRQEEMHRLHILATLRLMHAALENLVPRGVGGIINVASVAGFSQAPGSVSYNATKTWMNSFTEGIAIELAAKGSPVKVQALCPGFTFSEFHDVIHADRSAIPSSLWMTSDFVVTDSLRGFDEGRLFVIPGWRYKLIVAGMKLLPGALLRWASTKGTQRFRKRSDENRQ
jgi:short-subunit dehydrogenase